MSPLREDLHRVLDEYPQARQEALTGHPLAHFILHDLAEQLRQKTELSSYLVTGSPGRGNWAETPWVAVFDPLVTETAQRGFYAVFLFRGNGDGVYLSLNQGTTEVLQLVRAAYRGELENRARTFLGLLGTQNTADFLPGPIDLFATGTLSRGYEAGNILARFYGKAEIPSEQTLEHHLQEMLSLYVALIEARDQLIGDADPAAVEEANQAGVEAQRERWHKRTERNPRLARAAKAIHGTTCKVCGFNFEGRYGELGTGFIEAHHLVPLSSLRGRPTQLDARTDFTVACPNCHRMLHTRTPPLTVEELKSLLR